MTRSLWVGGGALGLLLLVVFIRPRLFRKSGKHSTNDFTKPRL